MRYLAPLLTVLLLATSTYADNWAHWRGPAYNGSSVEQNLPDDWSTTENIAWSVDLPGCAAATPIVWEDRVFISGLDAEREMLMAMCFDRASGKLLWKRDVIVGISQDYRSTFAAPSPVTDGKLVMFFYGNGPMICYDMAGKEIWKRHIAEDLGTFAFGWTFSSSPLLLDGKLYLQVLQRDVPVGGRGFEDKFNESYLLAMDPESGETLWRHLRPSKAEAESREAFSSPIPHLVDGKTQILIVGGDAITGHDPATGEELWRWGTWNPQRIRSWRLVPSPVVAKGVALACAPKKDPIYAIKTDGNGVLGDDSIAWVSRETREITSDVPTPAVYDGDFFILSDVQKTLARVEPTTGEVKWLIPTPGRDKYEASPLAADGKIYIVNFTGDVTIVDAADGAILNTIPMDEPGPKEVVRASIVASDGQLFIRTTRKLYCVGTK